MIALLRDIRTPLHVVVPCLGCIMYCYRLCPDPIASTLRCTLLEVTGNVGDIDILVLLSPLRPNHAFNGVDV